MSPQAINAILDATVERYARNLSALGTLPPIDHRKVYQASLIYRQFILSVATPRGDVQ